MELSEKDFNDKIFYYYVFILFKKIELSLVKSDSRSTVNSIFLN